MYIFYIILNFDNLSTKHNLFSCFRELYNQLLFYFYLDAVDSIYLYKILVIILIELPVIRNRPKFSINNP